MGKVILIIEDEKPIAGVLELKLQKEGYSTRVAYDGESALSIMKKENFDLILLDLVMPELDGFDVLRKLKKSKNKIPIIVASNLGQQDDIDKAMSLGAKDYFVKSNTSLSEIVEHVNKLLKKK